MNLENRSGRAGLILLALALPGCGLLEPTFFEHCPGDAVSCGTVDILVEPPPEPWPPVTWLLRVVPVEEGRGIFGAAYYERPSGRTRLLVKQERGGTSFTTDTASMWVVSEMVDHSGPIRIGVRLPTFAVDSQLVVVRFAERGRVPPVVRVDLVLERP